MPNLIRVAVLGAAFCLVLMGLRLGGVVWFSEAMQAPTSGWEEESLFALWKAVTGADVYADGQRIPYAISFFNWLFYETYGGVVGDGLAILSLGVEWLPTAARLLTMLGVVTGAVLCHASLVTVAPPVGRAGTVLAGCFAVLVFAGPLVGFFAMTARPDVWGTVFEVLAVLVFWRLYPRRPMGAVLAAAPAAYAAWAFKQVDVFAAAAIGLYLLWRRRWGPLGAFCAVMFAAYGVTLWLGTDAYRESLLAASRQGFSIDQFMANAINFGLKSTPALAALAGIALAAAASARLRRELAGDDRLAFAVCGVVASAVIALPASSKVGAAENYYFALFYFLCLAAVTAYARIQASPGIEDRARRLAMGGGILGWAATAVAVGLVLAGLQGVVSVAPQHQANLRKSQCMAGLEPPLFVETQYLALPWMNPSRPLFILSFSYAADRAAGRGFERGGVGGLIEDAYFGALVLKRPDGVFDGARLDAYARRPGTCANLYVFTRRPEPGG